MKKSKARLLMFVTAIVAYLVLGFVVINQMTGYMENDYYQILGNKAIDMAKMASRQLEITDKDVATLKSITFEEMLEHPLGKQMNNIFSGADFGSDVKYAYLWVILNDNEVKYTVTNEDAEHYGHPAGTPLNIMWLLDANEINVDSAAEADYFSVDKNRYSVPSEFDYEAWKIRTEHYIVDENEYGKAIVGFYPVYTVEGNFIGCLNIDIDYLSFERYINQNKINFSLLFILPSLILTIAYVVISIKSKRENTFTANTDPLTLLYNRRFLDAALPRLIREAYNNSTYISIIMLDIDFFKLYNDNYGHKAGDSIIIKISNAINSTVRKNMDFVCRYGGEEILIILPKTNIEGAVHVATKIQEVIGNQAIVHNFSAASKYITVSQGIYSAIPSAANGDVCNEYIEKADKAMYYAKTHGRNQYAIYDEHLEF